MSRRRYKIGLHSAYDKAFDNYKRRSVILNTKGFAINEQALRMADKRGLQAILVELTGDKENGTYFTDGQRVDSKILLAEKAVAAIEKEFALLQHKARDEGRKVPRDMHPELEENYHLAIARRDVILEEADLVEKKLAEITESEKSQDDGKVLQFGPRGIGRIRPTKEYPQGVLVEVDGQKVEPDKKGILRIKDPRSQYNGLGTEEYFEDIVKPWCRARNKAWRLKRKEWDKNHPNEPYPRRPSVPWPKVASEKAK